MKNEKIENFERIKIDRKYKCKLLTIKCSNSGSDNFIWLNDHVQNLKKYLKNEKMEYFQKNQNQS